MKTKKKTVKNIKKDIEKPKVYQMDASGKSAGRLATMVAVILNGKNRPNFSPHKYEPVEVIVKNLEKLKFTGKKLRDKEYFHHSGYPGGLKSKKMEEVFEKDPRIIFHKAVYNMLPKTKLRRRMMKSLKLYK